MRQDGEAPWTSSTLTRRELGAAKVAVAAIADTHVFDWNTVSASRRRGTVRLSVVALPEPQADGSIAEHLADCFGARDDWDCKVQRVRSLHTQIVAGGVPQRVMVLMGEGIETAEAVALVRRALEVMPTLGDSDECPNAAPGVDARLESLRRAFAARATPLPLVVDLEVPGIYVRSLSFSLNFSRGGNPVRHEFQCWSHAPTW